MSFISDVLTPYMSFSFNILAFTESDCVKEHMTDHLVIRLIPLCCCTSEAVLCRCQVEDLVPPHSPVRGGVGVSE